jgi:hypothetical protein
MADDSDADIVEVVVGKDRDVALIVGQSVAQIAARLGVERIPSALGRIADRVLIAGDETSRRTPACARTWRWP